MAGWMRVAGLAVALSIAESCSLKPPGIPHLDVSARVAPVKVTALAVPAEDHASAWIPAGFRVQRVALRRD